MGSLVLFEIRKILDNKAGMAACIFVFILIVAVFAANLITADTRDYDTGQVVKGLEAQSANRALEESHAGILDNEQIAVDAAVFDRANALAKATPDFYDLSNQQIIDKYGLEFWQETRAVMNQYYYMELVGTLDLTNPRADSLQEGTEARIENALSHGFQGYFPYSNAEKAYWREKAASISWPLEYGYADGWHNVLTWMSFSGLVIVAVCIALSGAFAREYQNRTVAVVLPTKLGKRTLPAAKVIASIAFATVYWWICAIAAIVIYIASGGADGWNLPVQVVFGFDSPYPLTIGQVVVAVNLLGYLITLGMTALTLLLSAKIRSTMPVAVITMAYVFLGAIALFMTPLVKFALITPFSGLSYAFSSMVSYAMGPVVADLPTVLATIYGIMIAAFLPLAIHSFRRHQVA